MNKISNDLKPKCNSCCKLNATLNTTTLFSANLVQEKHITLTCAHMDICEMYKEFNEGTEDKH